MIGGSSLLGYIVKTYVEILLQVNKEIYLKMKVK
jgi:hypothetical protein